MRPQLSWSHSHPAQPTQDRASERTAHTGAGRDVLAGRFDHGTFSLPSFRRTSASCSWDDLRLKRPIRDPEEMRGRGGGEKGVLTRGETQIRIRVRNFLTFSNFFQQSGEIGSSRFETLLRLYSFAITTN